MSALVVAADIAADMTLPGQITFSPAANEKGNYSSVQRAELARAQARSFSTMIREVVRFKLCFLKIQSGRISVELKTRNSFNYQTTSLEVRLLSIQRV